MHLLLEYYAMAVKPYWTGMYAGDGYLWSRLPAVQTEPVVLLLAGLQGGQGWHIGVARLQHSGVTFSSLLFLTFFFLLATCS